MSETLNSGPPAAAVAGGRRIRWVIGAVVIVVVIAFGLYLFDGYAKNRTADEISAAIGTREDITVSGLTTDIAGFPFLTQALSGELDQITVTADALIVTSEADDIYLDKTTARLSGVSTSAPHIARTFELQTTLPLSEVERSGAKYGLNLSFDACDTGLCASGEALGLTLVAQFDIAPMANGRGITISATDVKAGSFSLDIAAIAPKTSFDLQIDQIPPTLALTSAKVTPEGVTVEVRGNDVDLDALQDWPPTE